MRLRAALAAAGAALVVVGCGVEVPDEVRVAASSTTTVPAAPSTTAPPMSDDDLEQALIDNGYAPEEAACGAEALREELDDDEIRAIVEADSVDDIPPQLAERFTDALAPCVEDPGRRGGPRRPR